MTDYDTKIIPILDDIIEDLTTEEAAAQEIDSIEPDELTSLAENSMDMFDEKTEQDISDDREPALGEINDADEFPLDEYQLDEFQNDETCPVDFTAARFTALHTETGFVTQITIDDSDAAAAIDRLHDSKSIDADNIESELTDFHSNSEAYAELTSDDYPIADDIIELAADAYIIDDEPGASDQPSVPDTTEATSMGTSIETVTEAAVEPPSLEAVVDDIVKQLIPDLEQQLRFLVQQALEDRLPDVVLAQLTSKNTKS